MHTYIHLYTNNSACVVYNLQIRPETDLTYSNYLEYQIHAVNLQCQQLKPFYTCKLLEKFIDKSYNNVIN